MSDKKKNADIKKMPYIQIEQNKLITLFKWKSDKIEIPYNMELLLRTNGSIGYATKLKKWVVGSWSGIVDDLNRFTTYVCKTLSTTPETYELNRNDVIVCGNNYTFTGDMEIVEFMSSMKEETDISILYQLVNSRNIPMIAAQNDKVKKEIELAFQKMKAGVPVVVGTSLIDELVPLDITDKNAIEKMQYLNSFYDVLEKRNAQIFGIDVPLIDKRAQVNEKELDNFDDVSSLNFLAYYEPRLKFCEEMKKAGIDIECVRNPIYADEPTEEEIESEEAQEKEEEKEEEAPENPEENKEGAENNEEESN